MKNIIISCYALPLNFAPLAETAERRHCVPDSHGQEGNWNLHSQLLLQ